MKISTVKAAVARHEDGAVVEVMDELGEPYLAADGSQSTITVLGSESKRYRDVQAKIRKRTLRDRRGALTADEVRANRVELASAVVTAWHGWEDDEGAPIPFSVENVAALLASAEHVLEQVEVGIHQHASFFGTSSER